MNDFDTKGFKKLPKVQNIAQSGHTDLCIILKISIQINKTMQYSTLNTNKNFQIIGGDNSELSRVIGSRFYKSF